MVIICAGEPRHKKNLEGVIEANDLCESYHLVENGIVSLYEYEYE